MNHEHQVLKLKPIGIDTYRENIIYMHRNCHICQSEGFTALTRIMVHHGNNSIIATLNVIHSDILDESEAALSDIAIQRLQVKPGDLLSVSHLNPILSLSSVRSKIYGHKLDKAAYKSIIKDITNGLYADIEIAAFLSACSSSNIDLDEIISLTEAMVASGAQLQWDMHPVLDKHSIGGLPGNRTTPIVVAIIAACGLTMPKTSSRAITSPAGTADTMETITNVSLSLDEIKTVVNREGGCFAWGGSVGLSPADDILITIEKALDIDNPGQMIASVLSKKAAAGSTYLIIEIPVGDTAKVRTSEDALKLQKYFHAVANALHIQVEVLITDGSQPVGKGIGPVLEALDIISVLKNELDAPQDLKQKALLLAGHLLELSDKAATGKGETFAKEILESGRAFKKFQSICHAQGRFTIPEKAAFKKDILSDTSGTITAIDNRKLAKIAKLAGAPNYPAAGIFFLAPVGRKVYQGDILFSIYAETEGTLQYTVDYLNTINNLITIQA